jgi:hypothetical protein
MLKELSRYTHKEDDKYITYIPIFNNYVNEQSKMTLAFLIGKLEELRTIYGDCPINISEITNEYLDVTLEKDSTKDEIEEYLKYRLERLAYTEECERKEYERLKAKFEFKEK